MSQAHRTATWNAHARKAERPECRVDGCDGEAIYRTEQLCKGHYMHQRRTGTIDGYRPKADRPKYCTHPGCHQPVRCIGYCRTHYERARRSIPMDGPHIPKTGHDSPAWQGDSIRYHAAHRKDPHGPRASLSTAVRRLRTTGTRLVVPPRRHAPTHRPRDRTGVLARP